MLLITSCNGNNSKNSFNTHPYSSITDTEEIATQETITDEDTIESIYRYKSRHEA